MLITWPCSAAYGYMREIYNEKAFSKGRFAFQSNTRSSEITRLVDVGTVDSEVDQV